MLLGHKEVVEAISSQLPPVSIITGPPSVGKRMIATYAAMRNNISRVDFTEVTKLTVDEAVRVKQFMSTKPMQGSRFALIDLDRASKQAVDKLLIILENPPSYAKFSMISSSRVPRTLRTRASKFNVGLLDPDDLLTILLNKNIPAKDAAKLAKLGRVDLALNAWSNSSMKHIVVNVLSAVESNDYVLFMQSYKAVDDVSATMILTALEESAAQSWKMFNPEHLGAFANQKVALKVLAAWATMAGARQQLAIRVALESVMRG